MSNDNDRAMVRTNGVGAIVPRTIDEVARLAKMAAESGLAKTTSPQAAGMLICAGLEIGLTPMQALLGMHMVEGRPTLAADTIVALVVRRTDVCEYWRPIESTAERHTIETKRRGDGFQPVRRTWTMDDAKRAGLATKAIWQRYPADMLRHRCSTALAREVFPDVIAGMAYTREEIGDGLHNGDAPESGLDLADPTGTTLARPAIDALPANVTSLPRDNGLSPSGAPLPDAAPVAPQPLTAAEQRAMLEMIAGAPDAAALKASLAEIADDVKRGTDEQRGALRDAANARFAALKPPAPKPDGDEPPPNGPTGGKRARKALAPADATSDAPAGTDGASAGPQAVASWLRSEGDTVAHAAGIDNVDHLEASARRHGRHLASSRWGIASYAARLEALDRSTVGHADRIVTAWCAAGPKAQRRAA